MENKTIHESLKKYKPLFVLIPFLTVFFIEFEIDNDFYWIFKTGEHICNVGFPTKDFLTMHTNMDIVVQQWIFDVLSYKLYSLLGAVGPMLVIIVMYLLFNALVYKLCTYMTDKNLVTTIFMVAMDAFMMPFVVTRPQMFTYCIVLTELICLEEYAKTGKIKSLFVLPLLSVLGVNIHASMWTMQFILLLPYFVSAIPLKINGKSIAKFKLLPLLAVAVVMVGCGFINPYGWKGLAFIFTTSVGGKVGSFISELMPLSLDISTEAIVDFLPPALIIACYMLHRKGKTELRYALLAMGTMVLMFLYIKLIPYFIICSFPFVLKYLDNIDYDELLQKLNKPVKNGKKQGFSKGFKAAVVLLFAVVYLALIGSSVANTVEYIKTNGVTESIVVLQEAVDAMQKDIDENNVKDVRLFNGFNTGGYLEFKGYTTYIDARADNFIIDSNHDFDYLVEYRNLQKGTVDYKEVFEKYDFNYFFIEKRPEKAIVIRLHNDDDYTRIFESEKYICYKKK